MFDWSHFLAFAEKLRHTPPDDEHYEAVMRSAVSRAYYAAYCHVRNREAEKRNFKRSNDDPGERGRLHKHLRNCRKRNWLGDLEVLWQWRVMCDYGDEPIENLSRILDEAIETSRRFLESYP